MSSSFLTSRSYIHNERISTFSLKHEEKQAAFHLSIQPNTGIRGTASSKHSQASGPRTGRATDPERTNAMISPLTLQYGSYEKREISPSVQNRSNRKEHGPSSRERRRQLTSSLDHISLTKYGTHQEKAAVKWKRLQNFKPASKAAEVKKQKSVNIGSSKQVSKIHGFLSQRNIKRLLNQTNYDRRELYVMYVRFKALCAMSQFPNGIDKSTFKKGVARLAVEDDLFVDRVFDLVDEDGSGCIEWPEFLSAMSALEKGNQSKKMTFFLRTYDLDGDGFVSRSDLYTMLLSSSMLEPDEVTLDLVNTFVKRLFETLGAADKGKLSLDDILLYMSSINNSEDIWEVFGRSMLRDFGGPKIRRHHDHGRASGIAEMS